MLLQGKEVSFELELIGSTLMLLLTQAAHRVQVLRYGQTSYWLTGLGSNGFGFGLKSSLVFKEIKTVMKMDLIES